MTWRRLPLAALLSFLLTQCVSAQDPSTPRFQLLELLEGKTPVKFVTYTPSELDPRNPANQDRLATSSIRADLTALRPAFDGLILYGYHEACTPRLVAVARDLKYRAIILAIWNPKSTQEIDGVTELARRHFKELALAVLVGNEGLTFKRYEGDDLTIAAARLHGALPRDVPIGTSEPLVGYEQELVRNFGDFLAPNIHPVFDRSDMPPAEAAAWARAEALKLAELTGKPVILKETGFPHAGKPMYSPDSQQAYWEAYVKPGLVARSPSGRGWAYHGVAFEAFDLPWKSAESGLEIERSWGLLSPQRTPHPAFEVWRGVRP